MISVEVRSSAPQPTEDWGWQYPQTHHPLQDGRVVAYWCRAAAIERPGQGVAITIRVRP